MTVNTNYLKSLFLSLFSMFTIGTQAQLNLESLEQFSEKNGLSSESVNAVLVDNKGYIWIGTPNGLSRFNGYEFKQFFSNPTDSTAIQGMLIYALTEDHENRIWAGTNPSYLEVFDPKKNTFHSYNYSTVIDPLVGKNPLYGYTITSIREDVIGRIYFIATSYSDKPWLLYLDPTDDAIKIRNGPDGKPFRDGYRIRKDPSGKIWLLSGSGMYIMEKNNVLTPFHALDDVLYAIEKYPTDITFTKDNHMIVITHESVLLDVDLNTGQYNSWESDLLKKAREDGGSNNKITLDSADNIWIGTKAGLFFFDRKKHEFEAFTEGLNKDFEEVSITALAMDHFGNPWIGTSKKGLLRYEEKPNFISYRSNSNEENELSGWVGQIVEAPDGKIWLANDNGINILDIHKKEMKLFRNKLLPINTNISTVWKNEDEMFLAFYDQSVYGFSPKDQKLRKINTPDLLKNLTIRAFKKDMQGNEWFGTDAGLYYKKNNSQTYEHYDLLHLPGADSRSNNINVLFESPKHGLWLLTDNGLFLYRYDEDTIERHGFDKHSGDVFTTQDMSFLYEGSQGITWVGLWQGGLARYNVETKKIKNYTIDDGLPSMSIQGILGDENNGTLWLSSFNGLSRFDPTTEKFNNFSVTDGIQGSQFSDGSCLKTSEGLFIFGGSNGITVFDPNQIKTNYDPPKVFLTDFKLFNKSVIPGKDAVLKKPIDETDEIILNYKQNDLSIQFVGLHFSNPLKNEYAYTLENYDDTWRNVGNQNQAFYPNLSPGKYLFKVKAANDKGVWSDENTTLQIVINPPWWRTWVAYSLYIICLLIGGWLLHLFQKTRTIRIEREKSKDRELKQAKEIEKAYTQLKATQSQLIQAEKMASLGELTAGIAHEIQNPLNFVNNFSEVSEELLQELKEELGKGDIGEASQISDDVIQNLQKIHHHGKRASNIVKGMLEHSRTGDGVKELTDINALADEYLRLAYHGLRAKDQSFTADFKTEFDESLPKINVIPQDIGRVLLNLINNAFYAADKKAARHPEQRGSLPAGRQESGATDNKSSKNNCRPEVVVSTRKLSNSVEISVKDNGEGIPEQIRDKIFQPFFTTKPTGSGTGLGLSLSYDIVKAHGGELKVESKEGEGSEFSIQLPF